MRHILAILSFASVAVCCTPAPAAIFTSTLDLVPPSASENRLDVTLLNSGFPVGSDTTDFSGTMTVQLDINSATKVVSGLRITGGAFTATPWTIPLGPGLSVRATETGGTFETPGGGFSSVSMADEFNATEHNLIINSGVATAPTFDAQGNVLDPTGFVYDFSVPGNELVESGSGNGKLTLTPTATPGDFQIRLELPVDFISDIDATNSLQIAGLIAAEGVVAVPEASHFFILSAAFTGVVLVRWRRRDEPAAEKAR